ncbi:MAG: Obg family GTPase CgtA, partial [Lachnospiraceae bacterium]|nr:Obg family GTPase CgtA [Lachnospiraceae bacterium]
INEELEAYQTGLSGRTQVIAANKTDVLEPKALDDVLSRMRKEFEPKGISIFPISAVTGAGVKELLSYAYQYLKENKDEPVIFEQEYFPEFENSYANEPYTVSFDEKEQAYIVEGPRIEKMLGYTNLESEKGFLFFQEFLKKNGILKKLEEMGIQDGDTVRMYGFAFDYYQ